MPGKVPKKITFFARHFLWTDEECLEKYGSEGPNRGAPRYKKNMYRVSFLTGAPLKVLSVRLHSKSHQKSSKCQNLLTEKNLWFLGGSQLKKSPCICMRRTSVHQKGKKCVNTLRKSSFSLRCDSPNQEFLVWASSFQEFLKWASSNQEFLKWASSNQEFWDELKNDNSRWRWL